MTPRPSAALRSLAELVAYAATRRDHDRHDRDASAALRTTASGLDLPPGLELTWLGVAGVALTYEGTRVLIDPYVSRPPLGEFLKRRVLHSDRALVDRHVPRADAVLLGHTHFDHALDAPLIARRDGCPVYGGESASTLMALHGLPRAAVLVEPHRRYEIGPFEVTFVPSVHSRLVLGLSVPSDGEITCEHLDGMTSQAYRCGQVWGIRIEVAGRTFYHQGSADLVDDEIRSGDVDYFLCGIAGRQVTEDYFPRVLRRLSPRHVVALHQDDFFRPLTGDTGFAFGVDLAGVPDQVAAVTREIEVSVLPLLTPLRG